MKKLFVILLAFMLGFTLVACGNNNNKTPDSTGENNINNQQITNTDQPNEEQISVKDPLELLNTVWSSYTDDEKFSVTGGDTSEENMTMDGPGKYSIKDAAAIDSTLGFPSASIDKIDNVASLVHMMNANTFTCGAFHVKNADDISTLISSLKDNIQKRQWICGIPEKLVIATVEECIVAFFGEEKLVDTFKTKLSVVYPSVETICEEPIA